MPTDETAITEADLEANPQAGGASVAVENKILEVRDLVKHFPVRSGLMRRQVAEVHAVCGVTFDVGMGETLGLVGESGCGKSTTGRMILKLIPPTAGSVTFRGQEVTTTRGSAMRNLRRKIQIVFQDPYASLNPRMTVNAIIAEPLHVHDLWDRSGRDRVRELMRMVGLDPEHANRYPHEFSGGQRQRIAIARALALHPKGIVADEAVSARDVSVQAQIVTLLIELQAELGLGYIFISHDMAIVERVSHRV